MQTETAHVVKKVRVSLKRPAGTYGTQLPQKGNGKLALAKATLARAPRATQLLEFIYRFTAANQYPPSMHEMREHLGAASVHSVTVKLRAMRTQGLVTWRPGSPRTSRVTEEGLTLLKTLLGASKL